MMAVKVQLLGLLVVLGTYSTSVSAESNQIQLEHEWEWGFKSNFAIDLSSAVTNGWRITLQFSKPVASLQIWRANIVSVSKNKMVYELKNKPWNRQLRKGDRLEMAFLGNKTVWGSLAPIAKVLFRRVGIIRPTTQPPTQPPSRTPTQLPTQPPSRTPIEPPTQPLSQQPPTKPPTHPPTQPATHQPTQAPTQPPSRPQTRPPTQPDTQVPLPPQTASPSQGNVGSFVVTDEWGEGFNAKLKFSIGEDTNGWSITLTFSRPVGDMWVWKGHVTPSLSESQHFTITNRHYNAHLRKCTILELGLQAQKVVANEDVPTAHASIDVSQGDGNCPSTLPPDTQPPVTPSTPHPPTGTSAPGTTAAPPPSPQTQSPGTTVTQQPSSKPTTVTQIPTTLKPQPGPFNYDELLHKSILFYEAQRSGKLPANNRVPWRKDSALNDRGNNGEDLTGGWYDAGDYVKFGFPMASSATVLAWGLVEYRDAYQSAGELSNMLDSLKWATDYFIKAHTGKYEFYGQIGDGQKDHSYWGRPEDMTMDRPSFKITASRPGSDLAAETAAALAAAAIAFKTTNPSYAQTLVTHARELYEMADLYRGKYTDSIPNAVSFYNSWSGYNDELVWGAAWLYRATQDKSYLTKAEKYARDFGIANSGIQEFSWDDKKAGALLLLSNMTDKDVYKQSVQRFLNRWLPGGGIAYTPKGLAWHAQWGPNRYSANTAFLALVAADLGLKSAEYRDFAKKQIHYMLGDSGRSFVVGFGTNPPKRPHHRSSSCPLAPSPCNWSNKDAPGPNPQVLYGALVGGPDRNDNYKDDRGDYIKNEVATDYNAGFQSAVAGLKRLQVKGLL